MQNVGLPKSLDTNLNTAGSEVELRQSEQPLLRKALSDHFGKSLQSDNEEDDIPNSATQLTQQGSEEVPKVKARSRFSSAFRSFRGSKQSKKKFTSASADTVVSSGGEEGLDTSLPAGETPTGVKKKKSPLSKKFSLSAIKRNKVQPKKAEAASSNPLLVTSSTQTTQTLDRRPIFSAEHETKRKVTVTTITPTSTPLQSPESSPTKFDKVRKIQITIQGKKIEHSNNNHKKNNSGKQSARKNLPTTTTEITGSAPPSPTTAGEADYLTSGEDNASKSRPATTPFRKSSQKKQKSKTNSNSPPTTSPHSSPSYCKSITSTISTTTTTEDKFVVTQSICDTPPQERAPAKPSRATGSSHTSTISSPPSAAATLHKSASHQIPKLRRQHLHVAESVDTEPHFMIREGTIERGRRFPRPSSIDTQDISTSVQTVQAPPLPTPLGAPDSLVTASPITEVDNEVVESKSLPSFVEETNEPQETITQPREPLSLPTLSSTATSTHRIEIERQSTAVIDDNSTPIQDTSPNEPSQFAGNNIQNPNLSGSIGTQPPVDKDANSSEQQLSSLIRFEVGTPVRPQRTSVLLSQVNVDSKDFSSIGSNKSSNSDPSVISESSIHQRRIHYVDQPSVYTEEERDILDGKKEALTYLSGVSEYSFDSEFSAEPPMPAFGDLTMDQEDPPIMTSSTEKREHLYKILVIGELGTGKTSFIKRYVHQFFSQNYRATIGVDFALKVLHWDANTIVRLQLWDIAGQERFGNMTRVYYKEAVGAFIVFDVTRSGTFDCVSKWKEDLDSKVQLPDGSRIPCILLANKCDQEKQGIVTTPEKMDEYVKENGFAGWFETSAKENINIDEAARALVNKILLNDKLISAADIADSERFNLSGSSGSQGTTQSIKSKCSC